MTIQKSLETLYAEKKILLALLTLSVIVNIFFVWGIIQLINLI